MAKRRVFWRQGFVRGAGCVLAVGESARGRVCGVGCPCRQGRPIALFRRLLQSRPRKLFFCGWLRPFVPSSYEVFRSITK